MLIRASILNIEPLFLELYFATIFEIQPIDSGVHGKFFYDPFLFESNVLCE